MVSNKKKQDSKDWVVPGDILSTTEEYVPGRFTEDDEGKVVSLTSGKVKRDDRNLVISVKPVKKRVSPKNGDIAYGQVIKLDGRHDTVRVGAICGSDGELREFVADANFRTPGGRGRRGESSSPPQFRIGDIVRGKFTRVSPFLEVAVTGRHFGSVKSLCSRCRQPLVEKEGSLYCDNCERSEHRMIADDYGNIMIFGDIDEK